MRHFIHCTVLIMLKLVICIGVFTGDEHYPLEVGVLDTADEVTELDEGNEKKDNGGGSKKAGSFVVNLHGLPYNATLEDIADFLEGLHIHRDL